MLSYPADPVLQAPRRLDFDPRPQVDAPSVGGLSFFVACVPPTVSHHHKKIVTIKTRDGRQFSKLADKPELDWAKSMLESLLLPHQPAQPVAGPVVVDVTFVWPWRASESKRRRAMGRVPHTSKPDASNAWKTLEDRLVALRFIEDDRAVVDVRLRKWWGDAPGISVRIRPWVALP